MHAAKAATAPLAALIAELDPDEVRDLVAEAALLRREQKDQQRREALLTVRREVYGDLGIKPAAAELAAAVRGDRLPLVDSEEGRRRARCRPLARKRLEELAGLDRFQIGASQIKNLLKAGDEQPRDNFPP